MRLLLAALVTLACAGAPANTFDVASIRPAGDSPGGSGAVSLKTAFKGGTLTFHSITLTILIAQAYNVQRDRIEGCPAWCNQDRFDVIAKTDASPSSADVALMLQALLTDRFHLVLRREKKEVPGYSLTTGKDAPKLISAKDEESLGFSISGTALTFQKMPMSGLASYLASSGGRPVQNMTGLKGDYDFTIDPARYATESSDDPGVRFERLRAAVEDQLGLKVESRKVTVENLVVTDAPPSLRELADRVPPRASISFGVNDRHVPIFKSPI